MREGKAQTTSTRRLIAITMVASSVIVLPFGVVAAMAVQIRAEIGFDETALGLLLSLFSVGALVSSPGVGVLIQHVGPSTGLRIAIALTAAGALGIGVFGHSWWVLAAMMLVCGCAAAMSDPATNLWIAHAVPSARHGTALGLKQTAGPISSVASGLLVPLVALTIGWRWAGVMIAVAAVALLAVVPSVGSNPARGTPTQSTAISHRFPLALLVAASFFAYIGQSSLQVFFVTSAVESGAREGVAGVLLAVGSAAAVGTRLTLGIAVDRRARSLLRIVAIFLLGGAVSCSILALASPGVIIATTPLIFASASGWAGVFHLAAMQSFPHATAKVTGMIMAGAFAGVVIGPISFGAIARTSYAVAWGTLAVTYVIAACIVGASRSVLRATVGASRLRTQAAT